MTALDDRCDICGFGPMIGVASVPAFPVSLAWCRDCLAYGVIPLFCVEATLCDMNPEQEQMSTLAETIAAHGLDAVKSVAAEWFLECYTWVPPEPEEGEPPLQTEGPGRYEQIGDYLRRLVRDPA
jgi:hypothetical protein